MACPSERTSTVSRIVTFDGDLDVAIAGQSVTLVLDDEIDVSRGDVLADAQHAPDSTDQFAGHLIWMHDEPLLPERQYLMKIGTKVTTAQVTDLRHKINVNTMEHVAGKTLELNEVAYCNFALDQAIAFDSYKDVRETGGFILIDRFTNGTVGAGMIDFGLRRATNLTWHELEVGKELRAKQKSQKPCILWFTGLSGSGKSTTADKVEQKLAAMGRHSYLLDGDNVRHGLNKDLGFTDVDRVENIRRVAEVSRLFLDSGLIVLVSFISPFRDERRMARELVADGEFIEVFVDTPIELCEQRDPKGLYKKARAGEIKNFTGIDSDYEPPENAEIVLKTADYAVEELADQVIEYLKAGGYA
jgi:bifunctional enzyme CysN/CysC